MNRLILSFVILLSQPIYAEPKIIPESWEPKSYEKVILPTKTPEGILFTRNVRAKEPDVYTLGYFIGDKIVTSKMLPRDLYIQLVANLRKTVFSKAEKDLGQPCEGRVAWAEGLTGKRKVKIIGYCVGNRREGKENLNANFGAWFTEVRRLLEI